MNLDNSVGAMGHNFCFRHMHAKMMPSRYTLAMLHYVTDLVMSGDAAAGVNGAALGEYDFLIKFLALGTVI